MALDITGLLTSAAEQIAPVLLEKLQSKLNPTELQRALRAGIEAAQAEEKAIPEPQRLFYQAQPDFIPRFLHQFFADEGVQTELLRPLQGEGTPQPDFLVEKLQQLAAENAAIALQSPRTESWMDAFVSAYFEATSSHLRFQLAREDYQEQLIHWFDDLKFAGIGVASQESKKSIPLANIFVMPDVVEQASSRLSRDMGLA